MPAVPAARTPSNACAAAPDVWDGATALLSMLLLLLGVRDSAAAVGAAEGGAPALQAAVRLPTAARACGTHVLAV